MTITLSGTGLQQIPSSEREVVYFDKARMEINDPGGDPSSVWFVTNGLLVVEMITGNRQFGNDLFLPYDPWFSNIAGDLNGPIYIDMQGLLNASPQSVGTLLTEEVDRCGNVASDSSWGNCEIMVGHVDTVTDHGIAEPFWTFMNSQGLVYEDGDMFTDDLFLNPFYATGRPITEAYWTNVLVAGAPRDVLLQCFERRCLT